MSEEEKQPQAGDNQTNPQAGNLETQAVNSDAQVVSETISLEEARKLRSEAANLRKRLRELEDQKRQMDEAKLSETERLQKRLAELERKEIEYQQSLQARTLEYEVKLQAAQLGIVDAEAAYRLINLAEIEFDDSGKPVNVDRVLRELISTKPYLVGSYQMSPTNPAKKVLTLDDIRRMQEDEINKRWDEVKKVLSGG